MAHKRMFSKDITSSDAFREMPTSSQALYFHLGMEADDDGFLDNYRGLMRAVNATDDDLRILIGKRFLILFPSKVVVVKHWLINNTIRKDRYSETKHLEEKRAIIVKENGAYTEDSGGLPIGNQVATQYRIEEDRKDSDVEDDIRTYVPDEESSRVERVAGNTRKAYDELIAWSENERGFKFLAKDRTKQYKAFAEAKKNGINRQQLMDTWESMSGEKFWKENGYDWMNVINVIGKRGV